MSQGEFRRETWAATIAHPFWLFTAWLLKSPPRPETLRWEMEREAHNLR